MMYLEKLLLSGILIFFIAGFLNIVAVVSILRIDAKHSQNVEEKDDSRKSNMLSHLW